MTEHDRSQQPGASPRAGGWSPPNAQLGPSDPHVAVPSRLTGRKLLLIVLGIVGGCGVLVLGALGVAILLGVKVFEAVR
jgi:hypothetical protein